MRKYKLGKQKKFLMLTSILSIVLLMSTSMAAAAISRSVADLSTDESSESSDVDTSLASDSSDAADDFTTPSVDPSSDSAESNPTQLSNKVPVADFSVSPQTPMAGEEIIFDGSISYDPDGTIVSYYWSYTVGSSFPIFIANGNEPICRHAFDNPGNYLVSLKVTDNKGATDVMNKLVKIPYVPSVTNEAKVDQSASTELTVTSEDEIISSDDKTTIQMQQTSSQQLINKILNQASPMAQTTTFGIVLFNASGNGVDYLANITHFETFGMAANINLEIISGTMRFKIFGGFVTAGPGDEVSISMFRGIFWKIPADGNPAKVGDQVTRMIGMGWFSI